MSIGFAEKRLEALETLFSSTDDIVAGSVGRAALLGGNLPSPTRSCGYIRDIDAFDVHGLAQDPTVINSVTIDHGLNKWLKPADDGNYRLVHLGNTDEDGILVPSSLLEPEERTTKEGVRLRTFQPATQLFTELVRGPLRPYDRRDVRALEALCGPEYSRLFAEIIKEHKRRSAANHPLYAISRIAYNNSVGRLSKTRQKQVGRLIRPIAHRL